MLPLKQFVKRLNSQSIVIDIYSWNTLQQKWIVINRRVVADPTHRNYPKQPRTS